MSSARVAPGGARRPILVTNRRDPLFGMSREDVLEYLADALRGRCLAAYLYGSFARDSIGPESDIDCMVVSDTAAPFVERAREFDDLRNRVPSLTAVEAPATSLL